MRAIQALLMGAFSSLVLLTVLIFLGTARAGDVTIYGRDWNMKGWIGNEIIFDMNWNTKGYIKKGK